MTTRQSVIIVGGGVMGCSVLYHMAALGLTDTLLLEQQTLAYGSTSRSQGVLRMHYSNPVTTRMAWNSLITYRNFQDEVGSSSGYVETGYLLVAPAKYRGALRRNLNMQQTIGVCTKDLNHADVSEIAPSLRTNRDEAYAYEPMSGYADPHLVTLGYARSAEDLGAKIRLETSVEDVEIRSGRVTGVKVHGEVLSCERVVVAAGPWSQSLLARIGLHVPLTLVRHQVLVVTRQPRLRHPTIGDVVNGYSARMDVPGLSLLALGEDLDETGPDQYDKGVDADVVKAGLSGFADRIPEMEEAGFVRGWSGLFTVTPDWHPVIGCVDGIDGLYIAVGFSGHGFKLAPAVGRLMAEIVLGRSPTIDASRLRLSRFAEGDLLGSSYPLRVLA